MFFSCRFGKSGAGGPSAFQARLQAAGKKKVKEQTERYFAIDDLIGGEERVADSLQIESSNLQPIVLEPKEEFKEEEVKLSEEKKSSITPKEESQPIYAADLGVNEVNSPPAENKATKPESAGPSTLKEDPEVKEAKTKRSKNKSEGFSLRDAMAQFNKQAQTSDALLA